MVACLLASSFLVFTQKTPGYLKAFPVYFLIAVFVQTYGEYLGMNGKTNIPLYNIYSTLEFSFYFFILRGVTQNARTKKILLFLTIFFPILSFLNIYRYQGTTAFHTLSYGIGCGLITVFCIVYFVELFQMPKAIDLMKSPPFWICTATLFSYICTFPFWGMVNMMTVSMSSYMIANTVVNVINIFSYILFLIAFLCRIRIRKFSS